MNIENTARTIKIIPMQQNRANKVNTGVKEKVCAYARVSTDSEDQLNSYENQCRYYNEKLSKDPNIIYVGLYADPGRTGTKMRIRKDFLRMIDDCRAGKITRIITKSVQRFARNTVECLNIARELSNKGITINFETNGIDTADPGSWLILSIMASIAEEESRTISHNVSWAYQKKFQKGEYAGGQVYGYKIIKNKFEIVQDQALVIKRIFNEFMQGKTLRAIQVGLEVDGIPSPGGKHKWLHSTIKTILQNEKYKGDLLLQKTYKADVLCDRKVNNGEKPKYLVSNNHLPIIDRSLFDAVQVELKSRLERKTEEVGLGNFTCEYAFSTIVECGKCGHKFRRHSQWSLDHSKKVPIWVCTKHQKEHDKCSMKPIKEECLEQGFLKAINKIVDNKEELLNMIINNTREVIDKPNVSTINELMNNLSQKQEELVKLSQKYSLKPTEEQQNQVSNLIDEIRNLQEQMEIIKQKNDSICIIDYRLNEIKTVLKGVYNTFNKEVCKALLEKVVVKDKHNATYVFKCGIAIEQEI